MSYGNYSEIYIAKNLKNNKLFKIGETTNARRRNIQLLKEDFDIVKVIDIENSKEARLFIESYLRYCILDLDFVVPYKPSSLDYFECLDIDKIDFIFNKFVDIVIQGCEILKETRMSEEEREEKNFLSKIPKEYRYMIETDLLPSLKEGVESFSTYYQFGIKKTQEYKQILKEILPSFGYEFSISENWSWIYFNIKKIKD